METERLEEVVRRAWEAYDRGDIEGTLAIFDPEIVVHVPLSMANAGTYRGHQGFLAWLSQWIEAWESFSTKVARVEAVGERHVVTEIDQAGVGRGSGIEVRMDSGWLFELRQGSCIYMEMHPSFEEAVAAAEARESGEAGSPGPRS